ncbi:U3 small nucleolar RNA-associated protein 18 homolog [Babylonia areolata]|uniref:U3 small nucleolar RNA-associated protein 18 homolog n=1 Tax=Babylonia areolata TaxID=304850 RepID=UPI003FD4ED1F
MLRLQETRQSEETEASRREPLGSKRRAAQELKELEKRVLGGEEEFTKALTTAKSKRQKKKSAAALNAATRKPVWEDGDDDTAKFEKLTGTPKWAKIDTEKPADDDSDLEDLAASTGTHLVASSSLAPSYLQLKRCPDGNSDSPNTGKLSSVRFHRSAQILMTASTDRSVRLFQVDGKNNKSLQNIFLDNFPVMSAEFNPCQDEIVMGSKHRSFYVYDMMAGKVVFVPKIKGLEEKNMSRLQVTPDGKLIVFLGQNGNIHLLSAKSKEWIHTLHMNGGVSDVTFSSDGSTMFATGDDGRIYVYDLTTRQCVHNFFDDGCVHGTSISLCKGYLACGSNTGVVNVYDREACLTSSSPRPLKAVMNLTTSCTAALFSPSAEILALASNLTEKAVKLVHVPSFSVFANFPEMNDTKIRIPWTMDFSPNTGYFAIGNQKGHALLYRVKHYGNY